MEKKFKKKDKILIADLTIKSKLDNLVIIREFIEKNISYLNIDANEVSKIILAVDEACSNIIRHAYKNNPEGTIKIDIYKSNNDLIIEIFDDGISFNPADVREPDISEFARQKKSGGFGVYLIKKLMDEVIYSRDYKGKNLLRLVKKLANDK